MLESHILIFAGYFFAALIFSVAINFLLLKFVKTLGIRNNGETVIRWSATSKPALGGITFFIIFLLSFTSFSFLTGNGTEYFTFRTFGLLLAVAVGFLLGLFDDAYNTRPWIKFFTQVFCGIILIVSGIQIEFFANEWANYALTIFWVVGIMNSINMLDNMDGITTIVSTGILLGMLGILVFRQDFHNPMMVIIIGTLASLMGFLYFNWNPSKMFMGDTGSQFLGVLLAGLGIMFFWNGYGVTGEKNHVMQVALVAMAFALPLIDTTTVFIKRIARGSSPFVGGKDHTTHHLTYLGLSDRQVALIFAGLSAVSAGFTIGISTLIQSWSVLHAFLFGAYLLGLFLVLFMVAICTRPASS